MPARLEGEALDEHQELLQPKRWGIEASSLSNLSGRCIGEREPVPRLVRKLVLLNPPVDSSRERRRSGVQPHGIKTTAQVKAIVVSQYSPYRSAGRPGQSLRRPAQLRVRKLRHAQKHRAN
jgi:hypothetical protein